uniref:CSON004107 protein n=1 Tax=Culicoides sonorensis TaxID=179676 RepID=A0A336MQ57_CULSO
MTQYRKIPQHHHKKKLLWNNLINFHNGHQTMLKSSFLFLISLCLVGQICGFGHVDPETIYAFENEVDAKIECTFNLSQGDGHNSSSLYFNQTCDNSNEWTIYDTSSSNVEILSANKIRFSLPYKQYSKCKYVCILKNVSHVAFTQVFIGKKLGNVINFKCRSIDWKNMTCEFTEMDNNLPMSYQLIYRLDHELSNTIYQCPLKNDSKRGRYCNVYPNPQHTNEYYKPDDYFFFSLNSTFAERTGLKGNNVEPFKIDHLANVIPLRPSNFRPNQVGTNNVTVKYDLPSHYDNTRMRFDYEISIKSEYFETWKVIDLNLTGIEPKIRELVIPLDHPFTDYDIRMRIKSSKANNTDEMWSSYVMTRTKTLSKVPDRPPTSTFGAFYIHDDDNLTIYWQQLKKYEENGANFQYVIKEIHGNMTAKNQKRISAEFSHLKLDAKPYEFKIWSTNSNGSSQSALSIYVPQKRNLLNVKISLIQTYNDNNYNLTWTTSGPDTHAIEKFIIFSCESRSGNPNTCDDQLEFQYIDGNKNSLVFPAEPKLIFAIAAYDDGNRTTGMIWNECRSNLPDYIGKLLHAEIDQTESDRLGVKWRVDCPDKSIVVKFNITICPGVALNEIECKTHFVNGNSRTFLIEGLKPFTLYKILLSMISTTGKRGVAFEVHEKTLETAPSAVRNLSYTNLTSVSVQLEWTEPKHINGIIRHQRIYYYSYEPDDDSKDSIFNETRYIKHRHEKNVENNTTTFLLDDLKSFTNYDVYVVPCTVECSKDNDSSILKFKTPIGSPSAVALPKVDQKTISWSKPTHVGGNLTFYELKIESKINGGESKSDVYRVKSLRCKMEKLCEKEANEYKILVRAVNVIASDLNWIQNYDQVSNETEKCETDDELFDLTEYELIPGEWSESPYSCYFHNSFHIIYKIFFSLIIMIILSVAFYFSYSKFIEMKKIEIDFPDSLKDVYDPKNRDSLFKALFSRKKPDERPNDGIMYEFSPKIPEKVPNNNEIYHNLMQPDDEMTENREVNETLEPLLDLRATNIKLLPIYEETVNEEPPYLSPDYMETSQNTATSYIQMEALENKSQQNNESGYVPFKRGIKTNNYVGNVLEIQPNARHSIKDMLEKASQLQKEELGQQTARRSTLAAKNVFTVIFTALLFLNQGSCFGGNGVVFPERVVKLVNSSVDVICTIDLAQTAGRDSSHLSFEGQGKTKIPQNQISILNSTSIKWHLSRATENDTKRYQCLLDGEGVGVTNLYIGYKPTNVTDFKCRSDNWQNMTCKFTKPYNPIPTEYQLTYITNIAIHYKYNCSLASYEGAVLECSIPYTSYRSTHELWTFFLTIRNELGVVDQIFPINNFAVIVPAPPENISFTGVTSFSVKIHWKLSYKLELLHKNHAVNFVHDVRILSEFDNTNNNDTKWEIINPSRIKKETRGDQSLWYYIELHELPYANSWYDVRIRVRTDKAEDIDEMYSEVSGLGFRTEPRRPDRPPRIDQGAFFINDDNDVYIFWEELSKHERNGPNASYAITAVRENGKSVKRTPIEITNTMAKFSKIDLFSSYEFVVKSKNSLGTSDDESVIRIPKYQERLRTPVNLKKLSQDGIYSLSWQSPDKSKRHSYTVFWCKPKNSLPNACEGNFHFQRVNHTTHNFSLIQNGSINFAVSTNSETSSSGMIWAMCTAAQSSDIGKIKTIWITQIDSSRMELQWKLDCMFDSIVKGYVIKYCPIKDPKTLECKENSLKDIKIEHQANNYTITQLKPYTTYKIVISMFSATRHGPDSDPLQNTTLEAKPTPPLEFKAYDVRNTSMKLEWKRPKYSNGVLMYYSIFYNGNRIDVYNVTNDTTKEPYEKMTYLLQNLTSFTNYELLIKACNQFCSENSNKDNKTTEIGVPGSMTQPSSTKIANDSDQIQISWSPPKIKSGHINYYELKTVWKSHGNKIVRETTVRIGAKHLSCRRVSPCLADVDTIEYYVRPVNVIRSPHAADESFGTTQVTQKYHDTTHNNRIDTDISGQTGGFFNAFVSSTVATKHPLRHHHQNCEENDPELLRWIALDNYSEHLPGEWSKASITSCMLYGSIDAKSIVTIICSIFLMGTVFGVGFKFYKKIKDMKNIVIILPPGLEDITKEIRPENLENGGMKGKLNKPDIIMDKINLYADEEEDRLLRKRADTDSSGQSQSDESHSNTESHEDAVEDNTYDVQGLIDDGSQSSNHSMSMDNDFEPTQQTYNNQEAATPTQLPQNLQSYPPIMSSGYVKPNTMLRPNASGYVQHTAMPSARPTPPTTTNGYVPYNQPGRPVMNAIPPENTTDLNNIKVSMKTPIVVTSTENNGISGYVTHKQLSDFGHRMQ